MEANRVPSAKRREKLFAETDRRCVPSVTSLQLGPVLVIFFVWCRQQEGKYRVRHGGSIVLRWFICWIVRGPDEKQVDEKQEEFHNFWC